MHKRPVMTSQNGVLSDGIAYQRVRQRVIHGSSPRFKITHVPDYLYRG
jgi:hypothetical protein